MPEHEDTAQYWLQCYEDVLAEHDKELLAYRKHLANKYNPVFKNILSNYTNARAIESKSEEGAPPNENSNWAPPFPEN